MGWHNLIKYNIIRYPELRNYQSCSFLKKKNVNFVIASSDACDAHNIQRNTNCC